MWIISTCNARRQVWLAWSDTWITQMISCADHRSMECWKHHPKTISTDTAKAKATRSLNSPAPAPCRSTAPTATPTTSTRHVLPNPNIHHRHRPVPPFSGPTATATLAPALTPTSTPAVMPRVERLRHTQLLFAPNAVKSIGTSIYSVCTHVYRVTYSA